MEHDRQIIISAGSNRRDLNWNQITQSVSELYDKLRIPTRGTETLAEYMAMKKAQQDALKDVGGYVGGTLRSPRRKANNVTGRDLITLDFDNVPGWQTQTIVDKVSELNCSYCIYSTRKHTPNAPRLRVIVPTDRTMTPDEYEPCARRIASQIGISMADPTTFEVSRLMYWPSCCSDSEFVYETKDAPLISADFLLSTYTDWHDLSSWPQVPGAVSYAKLAMKQGDPTEKPGVVGAFCRTYDIFTAMDAFLPKIYEPVDNSPDRYTYLGGSTTGGAVIYDDGKFLFSHHATDPCGGKLVNAFDLVRLHRFGDKDDDVKDGTPVNRLPSFTAMCELARSDKQVATLMVKEDFQSISEQPPADENALEVLSRNRDKLITLETVEAALKAFGITVRNNQITGCAEIDGMPETYSSENAVNSLPVFLLDKLKAFGIKGCVKTAVSDYLAIVSDTNRYNPVCDMFQKSSWDGDSRYSKLYGILGVDENSFQAVLIRKWMIQCVALAHNDFDTQESADGVLTLQGPQGIGKTLFFRKIAIKRDWFIEGASIDTRNKDTIINATGGWITELGELDSTLKRDQSSLKAFITAASDRYRSPYAQEPTQKPRRTSFCATVNPGQFLRDESGDRRFWVIPVDNITYKTLIALDSNWYTQLWAETYTLWKSNPKSFRLTQEEQKMLNASNVQFREAKPGEEEIRQALDFSLPVEEWAEVSASELKGPIPSLYQFDGRQIGSVLSKLCRENENISFRIKDGIKRYRLPIPKTVDATITN